MAKVLTLDTLETEFTDSFSIRNQTGKTAEIDISGIIGGSFFFDEDSEINTPSMLRSELKAISAIKADKIIVNIESPGGSLFHAFAMHDLLAQHPAEIEVRLNGIVASAATLPAMAGDTIKMSDNAMFLIHRVTGIAMGNADNVRDDADNMELAENRAVNLYKKVNRKGRTKNQIKKLMNRADGIGKFMDPAEAKAEGFIDEIFEPMKMAASIDSKILKLFNIPNPLNSSTMKKNKIKNLKTFIALLVEKTEEHVDDDNTHKDFLENVVGDNNFDTDDVQRVLDGDIQNDDVEIINALAEQFDMTLQELINEANGDDDDDDDDEGDTSEDGLFNQIFKFFKNLAVKKKMTNSDLKKHSKIIAATLSEQFENKIEEMDEAAGKAEKKHEKELKNLKAEVKALKQNKNVNKSNSLQLDNIADPDAGGERANTVGKEFISLLSPSQQNRLKKNTKEVA